MPLEPEFNPSSSKFLTTEVFILCDDEEFFEDQIKFCLGQYHYILKETEKINMKDMQNKGFY